MTQEYTKPYLTIDDQIELLRSRGMQITDVKKAKDCLVRIGYYRLSAYAYPFRMLEPVKHSKAEPRRLDQFREETHFATIVDLYLFDKRLRLLMLDALECVEVALRTDISLQIGQHDPWAHRKCKYLSANPESHAKWLSKFDVQASKAKDEFAKHFKEKYDKSDMPVWIAVELWDFGTLSHFVADMRDQDQQAICKYYDLPRRKILTSWLRTLNFVRNVCAHHGRLWNRPLIDQPTMPSLGFDARIGSCALTVIKIAKTILHGMCSGPMFFAAHQSALKLANASW